MYNLLVYPFSQAEIPLLRCRDMLKGYKLVSLVCLEGASELEHIPTTLLNGELNITSDYAGELEKCDTVLILDTDFEQLRETYLKKIELALSKDKQVLVNQLVYASLSEDSKKNSNVKVLDNQIDEEASSQMRTYRISQPDIPVITVMAFGENCSKFEAQLDLRKNFEERNYKILQFGTKDYCSLFGFEKIPSFLMSKHISLDEKVYRFNYYINKLILEGNYDAVVLGVPGGILAFNDLCTSYFGELSLVVSSAFEIDINMLCCYHGEELQPNDLKDINAFCKSRLSAATDYYYMSDRQYRKTEDQTFEFIMLDPEYCMKTFPKLSDEKWKLCHTLDENSKKALFASLFEELEDNIELV